MRAVPLPGIPSFRGHFPFAVFGVASVLLAAAAAGDYSPPRTSEGHPDLSGVWDFRTLTPLERPEDQQTFLSPEEAHAIEAKADAASRALHAPSDPQRPPPPEGDQTPYNAFWFDHGARVSEDRRTSLLIDPPDGRLPPTQPGVERQAMGDDQPEDSPVRLLVGGVGVADPESRGLAERCIVGFNAGPPIWPGGYNQNLKIIHAPGYVVVFMEMVHEARIIPTDGRGRLPMEIRPWTGSSLGRWEGDTLVVETTNFPAKRSSFAPTPFESVGTAEHMRLTERFRLVDDGALRYEYTVDDPATYTRPFTAALLMHKSEGPIYEYACHEGNYGLRNILSGARMQEKLAVVGSD